MSFIDVAFVFPLAVAMEKKEVQFRSSIEGFPKTQLKTTETVEKNPLPDQSSRCYRGNLCSGMTSSNNTNFSNHINANSLAIMYCFAKYCKKSRMTNS